MINHQLIKDESQRPLYDYLSGLKDLLVKDYN